MSPVATAIGSGKFIATTSYDYPSSTPGLLTVYWGTTGVGTPDSNPGGWSLDGTDNSWFDNGTAWEDSYSPNDANPGNYCICKFAIGAGFSGWSNAVLLT